MLFLRNATLSVLLGLALSPASANALGDKGHAVVALVAERLLTPAARRQVTALLAADTDRLTSPDLAARASWADRWRESSSPRDLATRQWHVVGLDPDRPDFAAACFGSAPLPQGLPASEGPGQDCVVSKVDQFTHEFGDQATAPAERLLAFKYLLNLVGDLHDPLDVIDRHDHNGADVKVLHDHRPVADSLRAYWDTTVIDKLGSDPQRIADALLDGAENETAEWSAGTPRSWALETLSVARDVAYRLPRSTVVDRSGTAAHRLDITYEMPVVEAARLQLTRAGVRLAVLLNAALR